MVVVEQPPVPALAAPSGVVDLIRRSKDAAGDQYVAEVLPARMFRGEFERRG